MKNKHIFAGLVFVVAALALAACGGSPTPEAAPEQQPTQVCPDAPDCPACPACPSPVISDVPFEQLWAASPHADASAEAFVHWDEADPKAVPANCAKCHSTPGFLDFLGMDGTAAGVVDNPAEIGTVVTCAACHNEATAALTSVVFPSGAEITGLGAEARCMECHQGRASTAQVNTAITDRANPDDLDAVSADLGFVNIHYFAAAATLYGTQVQGGYQYDGKTYDARFDHVAGYDTCIGCHNPHTLELKLEECSVCHTGVASVEDLRDVRMEGSLADYDGDGDIAEGIYYEIEGLRTMLNQALQAYASEVAGTAIVYDSHAHPYFFIDTNGNGEVDDGEAVSSNRYNTWTPRLLQAAYNYQTSLKDPGAFAHGGKYIVQLLYDSIEDLNSAIANPVDLSAARREDAGHFAASTEAFRHWDEAAAVPASCARCHSASGLPLFLKEAVNISAQPSSGLNCASCHDDVTTFTRFEVAAVKFPSGASLDLGNPDSNLCLNCHQGRESTTSVNAAIARAAVADDVVSDVLNFRNPHYFAAGATLFGTEAQGAYEYAGKTYNGRFTHVPTFNTCVGCHDTHGLEVKVDSCSGCHNGVQTAEDLRAIRVSEGDFDGDGDATEGLAGEIETMHTALLSAIQDYAAKTDGTAAIIYDSHSYPYWFVDTNENGVADPEEVNSGNRYATWTPTLLRATFNYQWVAKDPGAFAHNGKYIIQVLYDSLEDLGVGTSGMLRPPPLSD